MGSRNSGSSVRFSIFRMHRLSALSVFCTVLLALAILLAAGLMAQRAAARTPAEPEIASAQTFTEEGDPEESTLGVMAPITGADLQISTFVKPSPTVQAGEQFTYTIIVDNLGPDTAVNVVITDTLVTSAPVDANGCSIAVRTDGGAIDEFNCNFALSSGVFDLGTFGSSHLNPRSPSDMGRIIVTINATADGNVDLSSYATVTSDTHDPDLSNNDATTELSVIDEADLRLTKFVKPSPTVQAGEQFTYTIIVDNLGPSRAENVVITDTLVTSGFVDPNGCSIAIRTGGGAIDEFNCDFAARTGVWDLGTFGSNWLNPRSPTDMGRIIVTINATAEQETDLESIATVTSATPDPDMSNNSVTVPLSVTAVADLEIAKTDSADPVVAGNQVVYTLAVTNSGPSLAENVVIEDNLPAEVEVVSVSGVDSGGNPAGCAAGTPGDPYDSTTCNFGTLGAGNVVSMTVVVRVASDAVTDPTTDQVVIHNDALTFSDTFDRDNSDNLVNEDTTVEAEADLALSKFAIGTPLAGETFHYEYDISNLGPSVSRDVTLRDFLPDEVEFVSAYVDVEGGTGGVPLPCDVTTGSNALFCPLGDVAPTDGAPILVFVTVRIDPDVPHSTVITNNADVFLTDTPDPDPSNNADQAAVSVISEADLSVTKTTKHDPVIAGGTFAYSVTVRNDGPSLARDVTLTDTLPAEVSFVSVAPSQGMCAGTNPVVCDLDTIPSGGDAIVSVTVELSAGFTGTVNNTAEVTAANSDPATANNVVGLDTSVVCELPVYDNNFSGPVGPEWSDPERDATPNGHEFLGQFGNTSNNLAQFATLSDHGSVTLQLSNLPDHETVHLEFDLYVIRSWDGNTVIDPTIEPELVVGPDRWSARIGDGTDDGVKLVDTTFSNWPHQRQAYPGSYPSSDQPAQTGAAAVNTLGYRYDTFEMDAVYNFAFTTSHDADTLEVDFGAFGLQELADESWGLDNVEVRLSGCWPQHQQFLPVTLR